MDDTYIICPTKELAIECLQEMKKMCQELGIFVNLKKTQIKRLDQPFTFLKIKHRITKTGKIIRKISPETIKRNRTKMKKLYKQYQAGKLSYKDCFYSFVSTQGRLKQFNNYKTLRNFNKLHDKLYIENY